MLYTIFITVALWSYGPVSVSTKVVGSYSSKETCTTIAAKLNTLDRTQVDYNANAALPVVTRTTARCVQLTDH